MRLPFAFDTVDCDAYLTTPIVGVKVTISSSSSVVVFSLFGRGGTMFFDADSSPIVFCVGSESLYIICSGSV